MQLGSHSRAGLVALAATAVALAGTIVPGSASASDPSTSPTRAGDGLSAADERLDAKAGFPSGKVVQLLKQPDGTTFRARIVDLDQGGLFETTSGHGVERDADGTWRYITGWKGDKPRLGAAVTRGAAPAGLAKHLGRRDTDLSAGEMRVRAAVARGIQSAAEALAPEAERALRAGEPRLFKVPALMLETWYDEAKESAPTFHAGTDSPAYFKKLLNGFGGNPFGSVTQYYFEASFGQFLVQVDVYGTYTSVNSQGDPCYYGSPESGEVSYTDPVGRQLGLGGLGGLGMAREALPQAVDVPWDEYDNNEDGVVDFTMMIHSGPGHEVTGDPCHTHSHQISVSSLANIATGLLGISAETLKVGLPTTTPGQVVDRILTIPEYASADSPLTIGVAAHEMAHALGEPDYYDTSYSSVGTGDWDVMSGGSYLGNPSGSNPSMMSPATRVFQKYVTPTVVQGSLRGYTLKPRTARPFAGYAYGKADPNLLLVPTYEMSVGQTDRLGHVWTEEDVYGLAKNPRTGKYVVEGYYVENVSRNATSVKLDSRNPMGSMFDRQTHSGGLAVWHFDYWRQSTTYFGGANDAQSDSNRYQMDLEEFDQNDNTQELQLNHARGNAADMLTAAATGITSGTRMLPPGTSTGKGTPQRPVELTGTTTPLTPAEVPFTVSTSPANESMTVTVTSDLAGDCKLQLVDPQGNAGTEVDSGSVGDAEELTVKNPKAGTWKAKVSDFALCGSWSGRVVFSGGAKSAFSTYGAADTWSNWSKRATGWAFTNVRGHGNGLDMSQEAGGSQNITLDILDLKGRKDVSPGFIAGKRNVRGGTVGLTAGKRNVLQVPVFSNGSKAPGKVQVVIRKGSAKGAVVARRTVTLGAYQRKYATFSYRPGAEGPATLVAVVDPGRRVREFSEANQVQVTNLWVGPRNPKVLVVDDDQVLSTQRAIEGALTAMGVRYAETSAHPSARQLSRYKAVIWSSGVDRYEGQLDAADRRAIQTYLSRGGRVLLTGNRVMDAITTVGSPQTAASVPAWGAHWFGARTPEGNPSYIVSQLRPSTMIGRGLLAGLGVRSHPSAARQFVGLAGLSTAGPGFNGTTIKPYGKAAPLFSPDKNLLGAVTPESDKPFIGLKVVGDAAHGRFRTAVLGWNLGDDENASQTVKALGRVMRHFGVSTGKALKPGKRLIYHTSVRDSVSGKAVKVTAVVLGGAGSTPRLHYRRHARGGFYSVAMRRGDAAGTWVATIPARAVTPDGVDYYLSSGSARSPYAAGKRLWHSIAVGLPRVANPLPIKR